MFIQRTLLNTIVNLLPRWMLRQGIPVWTLPFLLHRWYVRRPVIIQCHLRKSCAEPLTAFVSVCDHNGSAGGIHVCCDSGRTPGSCCKNTTEVFTLAAPFSSITAGPASPTGATTATTTGIPDSAATTTGLSSAAGPALQTSTAPDPARATSTAAPTANAHHGATIGAAVGGALGGGIVLSVLALLWYWRRRKSRNVQPKRPKISRPFELPSADPTFRPNSSLFPAELHHHVSALSLSPAELEYKDYKKSLGPAELEHKDSMTSTVRNELSAKTGEQAAGPYELPGMEIDAITEPPSPVRFDENRRWPFTRPEHVGDSNVEDSPSTPSGRKEKEAVLRKPSLRHRPGSMSGPWHDRF